MTRRTTTRTTTMPPRSIAARIRSRLEGRERGKILAVKWGLNPNSSSLGVDVTFLLFGAAVLSFATPVVSALIRWRRPAHATGPAAPLDTHVASDVHRDVDTREAHEATPDRERAETPSDQ